MKEKFNQQKYQQEYAQKHYSVWKSNLHKDKKIKLDRLIKENGYCSNTDFLLKCIEILEKEQNIFRKKD